MAFAPSKKNARIILASLSPRRRFLFKKLGFSFEVDPSDIDESRIPYKTQREFALKAALAKAARVAERYKSGLVIGADTIVCLDGNILGKPRDIDEAKAMLLRLRGRCHTVITGVALVQAGTGCIQMDAEKTDVCFKRFRKTTLENYLATGDSLDKAGAYGIQGEGECLIYHIEGDYFNVMGLPLDCLFRLLSHYMDISCYRKRMKTLRRPF